MSRKPIGYTTLAAAFAWGVAGPAAVAGPPDATEPSSPEFRKLDLNRDGYLTREEARHIPGFERAFKEADDNGDGRLDADEFVKAQSVHDRMLAGQYLEDSVITARVKAALLKDPSVKTLAVSVETYKGTVLLSGFVESESQARRAAEIAAGVRGVVHVKSNLTVKI